LVENSALKGYTKIIFKIFFNFKNFFSAAGATDVKLKLLLLHQKAVFDDITRGCAVYRDNCIACREAQFFSNRARFHTRYTHFLLLWTSQLWSCDVLRRLSTVSPSGLALRKPLGLHLRFANS
jgi:hypothetical protein